MKYIYFTATERCEIEVDEQFYDILHAMDKEEYNSDRKHSRRYPLSLSSTAYDGDWMADKTDILDELISSEDCEQFHKALSELTQGQQALVERVFIKNEKVVDVAQSLGVSQSAVSHQLQTIRKKLKNVFNSSSYF